MLTVTLVRKTQVFGALYVLYKVLQIAHVHSTLEEQKGVGGGCGSRTSHTVHKGPHLSVCIRLILSPS